MNSYGDGKTPYSGKRKPIPGQGPWTREVYFARKDDPLESDSGVIEDLPASLVGCMVRIEKIHD